MKSFYKLCCFFLSTLNCIAQLPIQDGAIEVTTGTDFAYWTNQANNTAVAQFAIQTNNLIAGSTKAIQTDITSLGDFEYSIQSKSTHSFSVAAESKLTISFITAPLYAFLNFCLVLSKQMPREHQPKKGLKVLSIIGLLVLTGFTLFYLFSL